MWPTTDPTYFLGDERQITITFNDLDQLSRKKNASLVDWNSDKNPVKSRSLESNQTKNKEMKIADSVLFESVDER